MLGTYALSRGYYDAYYLKAQQVRTLIRRDFDAAFAARRRDRSRRPRPTAAFRLGEKVDDPLAMYLADIFTLPCNLAGLPGISRARAGSTRAGCRSALQLSAAASTRRRCCASPAPIEQAPTARRRDRPAGWQAVE